MVASRDLKTCILENVAFEKDDVRGVFICASNYKCNDRIRVSNGSITTFFCRQSPLIQKLIDVNSKNYKQS